MRGSENTNSNWELAYWGVMALLSNSSFIKISLGIMVVLVALTNKKKLRKRTVEIIRVALLTYSLGSFPLLPVFYPRIRFDIDSVLLSYGLIVVMFSVSNKTLRNTLEYM